MDLQRQSTNKWCQVDDMWFGNRYHDGMNYEDYNFQSPISGNQLRILIKKSAKPDDKVFKMWSNLELLLIKGHHWHRGKPIMKILHHADPLDISFVSPLRDPFLAIMTRSWQGWYGYGRKLPNIRPIEQRHKEARRICQTFMDILVVPPARMLLFPIDGELSKTTQGRTSLAKDLYKHCGLQYNQQTQEFVNNWKPINTSQEKSSGAGQDKAYSQFEQMKREYKSGNVSYIQKNAFCNFEFEFLQKEDPLKKLLDKAGYSNLLWW
jgi:hypothetical protein